MAKYILVFSPIRWSKLAEHVRSSQNMPVFRTMTLTVGSPWNSPFKNAFHQNCFIFQYMSRLMGKPTICIGENKGADQLRGNAKMISAFVFATRIVQFLFYLYRNFKLLALFCACIQVGLCQTCSKTTLLVFPRGGSIILKCFAAHFATNLVLNFVKKISHFYLDNFKISSKYHYKTQRDF